MRLRVCIPEALPGPDVVCVWTLDDRQGTLLRSGSDRVNELPTAEAVESIAPASRILLTRVPLPKHSRQRLRQVLAFAIEDKLIVDPERVHVALGPRVQDGIYAVAVVDSEWLRLWLAAFGDAGRAPRTMLVETCCVPIEPDTWTVVWREGGVGFLRSGPASGMALDSGTPTRPPVALQLVLREAQAAGHAPQKFVVRAAAEVLPDLAAWSSALDGVPCEAGDAWDSRQAGDAWYSRPAGDAWEWPQARDEGSIELLQGEFAPASQTLDVLPRLRPALILAALIVALQTLGTVVHWALLRYEKSSLQAQMRERFRSVFPQAQAIVDPALQTRRQLESLRRETGDVRPDDFVPLLAQAAPHVKRAANARVRAVSYEHGRLRFDLELDNRAEAELLLAKLKAGGFAVALEAVNPKGKGVDARFAMTLSGEP